MLCKYDETLPKLKVQSLVQLKERFAEEVVHEPMRCIVPADDVMPL
jgi:hypothetical protein